jgi:Cytochrome c7 and related cytochrome c
LVKRRIILFLVCVGCAVALTSAQTRRRKSAAKPLVQAPSGSAAKYSAFLHSSEKHKGLACNSCHKIPTAWTAKRDFPDVADFPDHDACVRCHRQQFFTRQAFAGTGPSICTVCHLRAAPREDARFAFGKPNGENQTAKPKDERQFTIEFPHDKHQNVIASLRRRPPAEAEVRLVRTSFLSRATPDDKKPDYNNCTICHQPSNDVPSASLRSSTDTSAEPSRFFKTMPHAHDACFACHWKNEKPASDDCAGCHKPAATFFADLAPKRISAKFSHEGGKGEHVMECTTCHINITRASTLRGLTPDVPVTACATCHKDNKKTTYPKIITIEDELAQFKKTGMCTYCHTSDVGKKKPPPSHEAAVQ